MFPAERMSGCHCQPSRFGTNHDLQYTQFKLWTRIGNLVRVLLTNYQMYRATRGGEEIYSGGVDGLRAARNGRSSRMTSFLTPLLKRDFCSVVGARRFSIEGETLRLIGGSSNQDSNCPQ